MNNLFISILVFALHVMPFNSGSITAEITDIKNVQGPIIVMLFNGEDGFPREPKKAFKIGKISSYGSSAKFTFKDVPYGKYAISVFQDEDNDGEIDTNLMGIPKESVGASNLLKMGRPVYDKCTFEFDSAHITIKLKFIF